MNGFSIGTIQNLLFRYEEDLLDLHIETLRSIRQALRESFREYFRVYPFVAAIEILPGEGKILWQKFESESLDKDEHSWYDPDPKVMGGFDEVMEVFREIEERFGVKRLLVTQYEKHVSVQTYARKERS